MIKKSIYGVLRGTFLISDDSFKNWKLIMFLSVLAIVMIASSHSADRKVYEIANLKEEVKELRSAFVDNRQKLMQLKMESSVIRKLIEKGLSQSQVPPKKIIVKEKN